MAKDHDWVRAVLYRTTKRDIDDGVMMLAVPTRIGLGEPGCYVCGQPYPGTGPCTGDGDGAPSQTFEPLVPATSKPKRRDVRTPAPTGGSNA